MSLYEYMGIEILFTRDSDIDPGERLFTPTADQTAGP